ncbi:MAG TPA: glycosyltransferase family 39 protein [Candidatus Sulfopaludibacter sp.]|nr:glycosyltransferase family 39 protein [Candidatus Sulfopaludibacter sp.]
MPRKIPPLVWPAALLACFTYLYGLGMVGVMGADEPRYASIAREMARSGDWVTPRLWGQPWFEKPALLYWVEGIAYRLGFGPELAPRLPVAVCALLFLAFFWWIVRREFSCLTAGISTLILATTGGYLAYSQVGHMDMLLTATYGGAMLLALPWIGKGETRYLPAAAALLGLAVLAKSGVALVLMLPLAWWGRRRLRDLLTPRVILPFAVIALPWYVVCYCRNGMPFVRELFFKQQFQRLTSGALQHVQPFWYYLPVLLGLLLPWTPLLLLLFRRTAYRDPRRAFLLALIVWGMVFFSLAPNKLAGYVLPLFPFAAVLMGLALAEAENPRPLLACCAALLVAFPVAAAVLPVALESGVTHAVWPRFQAVWLWPLAFAVPCWILDARGRRVAAVFTLAAGACAGMIAVKVLAAPQVDRSASARLLWRRIAPQADDVCVAGLSRNLGYSLNYYSVTPLPDCSTAHRRVEVRQKGGGPPYLFERQVDPAASPSVPSHFRD